MMLSRIGKLTSCNYPIFFMADPVTQHEKYVAIKEKSLLIEQGDPEKEAKESDAR